MLDVHFSTDVITFTPPSLHHYEQKNLASFSSDCHTRCHQRARLSESATHWRQPARRLSPMTSISHAQCAERAAHDRAAIMLSRNIRAPALVITGCIYFTYLIIIIT